MRDLIRKVTRCQRNRLSGYLLKRGKRDIVELVDRCTATVLFLLRRELDEIRNKVYKEKID